MHSPTIVISGVKQPYEWPNNLVELWAPIYNHYLVAHGRVVTKYKLGYKLWLTPVNWLKFVPQNRVSYNPTWKTTIF